MEQQTVIKKIAIGFPCMTSIPTINHHKEWKFDFQRKPKLNPKHFGGNDTELKSINIHYEWVEYNKFTQTARPECVWMYLRRTRKSWTPPRRPRQRTRDHVWSDFLFRSPIFSSLLDTFYVFSDERRWYTPVCIDFVGFSRMSRLLLSWEWAKNTMAQQQYL